MLSLHEKVAMIAAMNEELHGWKAAHEYYKYLTANDPKSLSLSRLRVRARWDVKIEAHRKPGCRRRMVITRKAIEKQALRRYNSKPNSRPEKPPKQPYVPVDRRLFEEGRGRREYLRQVRKVLLPIVTRSHLKSSDATLCNGRRRWWTTSHQTSDIAPVIP